MRNEKMQEKINRVSIWTATAVKWSFKISETLLNKEESLGAGPLEMSEVLCISEEDYYTWCSGSHIFNLMEIAIIEQNLDVKLIEVL